MNEGEESDGSGDGGGGGGNGEPPKKKRRQSRPPVSWEARIEELRFFKNLTGHCKVPWGYAANPSLAGWCDNQRRQRKLKYEGKSSSLTDERETTLTDLGFWWGFGGGRRIPSFEERVEELKQWRRENPPGCDADSDAGADGTFVASAVACAGKQDDSNSKARDSLSQWARHQTDRFLQGKLSLERIAVLRAVGLQLNEKDPSTASMKWQDGYDQLVAYRAKFGHCNVTVEEGGPDCQRLATWVGRQRTNYSARADGGGGRKHLRQPDVDESNRKRPAMKDDQLAELRKIGFLFKSWDIMFHKLERWKANHEGEPLPKPEKCPKDHPDRELKVWLATQKYNFRKWQAGTLSPNSDLMNAERIAKLLKIGFDFNPPPVKPAANPLIEQTVWKAKFTELTAYRDHFGDCNVPFQFMMNKALGKWVKDQRTEYACREGNKPTTLTDERYRALLGVGFAFEKEPPTVKKRARVENEITSPPPQPKPQQPKPQPPVPPPVPPPKKKYYKPQPPVPPPKKKYYTWEERLRQCKKYRKQHGNLSVNDDNDFGMWAQRQRNRYAQKKKGKSSFSDEKVQQLDELGFVWEMKPAKESTTEQQAKPQTQQPNPASKAPGGRTAKAVSSELFTGTKRKRGRPSKGATQSKPSSREKAAAASPTAEETGKDILV